MGILDLVILVGREKLQLERIDDIASAAPDLDLSSRGLELGASRLQLSRQLLSLKATG